MTVRAVSVRGLAPALIVVLMTGALVATTLVRPAYARDDAADGQDDPRAVSLLYRAMAAAEEVSFSGTQYVSAWSALDRTVSTSAVVDVQHTAGGPTLVTGHDARSVALSAEQGGGSWLAGAGGAVGLLVKAYDVRLAGQSEVAGRAAEIVAAHRRDGSVAARLWLDAEHALPLRREVYDLAGRTMSASAFVELEVHAVIMNRLSRTGGVGYGVDAVDKASALTHSDLAGLRKDGWRCPTELGGLALYEAHKHGDAVQLSYSDGIETISIFEQPGELDPDTLHGFTVYPAEDAVVYVAAGPPSQFVWSTDDGRVVTVVADGAIDSIDAALAAFPPGEVRKPGLIERIGRGAKKLASWLDPRD